ncbi:PHD finger protein 6 isoform X2 [Phyllopteryx taeniolatus]|uniref:PHD finger protein 6 isoform X2 n=1 Tax=Phyllopteryx taeniolatus TaxID=161469 RepID=UPI002AD29CF5|nr:PHD finger protein 6 isoform X2 [Phyllopteryx taeniolatus]
MVPSVMLRCVLCQRGAETEVTGALLTKGDVTAHQNCLLFSSDIYCTDSPLFDNLFGFSVEDVMGEVKRGSKLLCAKCKKKGATAGCEVNTCSKCYHYPCAIEDVAETVVDSAKGEYMLFCFKHKEKQQQSKKGGSSNEGDLVGSASAAQSSSPSKRRSMLPDMKKSTSCTKSNKAPPGQQMMDESRDEDLVHSDAESEILLSPEMPSHAAAEGTDGKRTERGLDAAIFWSRCNTAGCTDAIFSDFLNNMKDVSLRIRRGHASPEDYDVALKVLMASGKMMQLLSKQSKELEQKHKAMQEVVSLLRR